MIIYLDASALIKAYILEKGSREVREILRSATAAGTSLISKVEVAAAMAMVVQRQYASTKEAQAIWGNFLSDWPSLFKLALTDSTLDRGASIAWEYGLCGYSSIHLASALSWGEATGHPINLVTFDRKIWGAAQSADLSVLPADLDQFC